MLRCSNATAFRTQFTSIAQRPSSSWARARVPRLQALPLAAQSATLLRGRPIGAGQGLTAATGIPKRLFFDDADYEHRPREPATDRSSGQRGFGKRSFRDGERRGGDRNDRERFGRGRFERSDRPERSGRGGGRGGRGGRGGGRGGGRFERSDRRERKPEDNAEGEEDDVRRSPNYAEKRTRKDIRDVIPPPKLDSISGAFQSALTASPRSRRSRGDDLLLIAKNKGPEISTQVIKREMKWLHDRVELRERVTTLLAEDKAALAVALVRQASQERIPSGGSWNAIFDYCFLKGDLTSATRFWNDMKKRHIQPSDRSYTTFLRGLSQVDKTYDADPVKIAWTMYRSLLSPGSKTVASLIHHNAMLTVCANHLSMDALWEVAGQLPEEGPNSPDNVTYTIILNAIRRSIQWESGKLQEYQANEANEVRKKGVVEGKKVWADAVHRWENGHFEMSNELVSSMAGVLMEGTGDWNLWEVLKLYEQTTGIPVFMKEPPREDTNRTRPRYNAPPMEERGRENSTSVIERGRRLTKADEESNVPFVDARGKKFTAHSFEAENQEIPGSYSGTDFSQRQKQTKEEEEELQATIWRRIVPEEFTPRALHSPPNADGATYVPITNRELTIIMETCTQLTQGVGAAKAYWEYLVENKSDFTIVPDPRSFTRYLRLLRVARQSRITVDVIRDQMMPLGLNVGLPFHLGFTTCRRDINNPNVFKNSNEMLRLMDEALVLPDCRAVSSYLDVVRMLHKNPQHLLFLNDLDPKFQSSETKLDSRGRLLQDNLYEIAISKVKPLVAKLEAALKESTPFKPRLLGTHGVPSAMVEAQAVPAESILEILNNVTMLAGNLIKSSTLDTRSWIRDKLKEDSEPWRYYSNEEVQKKLVGRMVYATVEQQKDFYERNKEILEGMKQRELGVSPYEMQRYPVKSKMDEIRQEEALQRQKERERKYMNMDRKERRDQEKDDMVTAENVKSEMMMDEMDAAAVSAEETRAGEVKNEEIMDEKPKEEELKDEKLKDEEVKDQETKDEAGKEEVTEGVANPEEMGNDQGKDEASKDEVTEDIVNTKELGTDEAIKKD